MKMHKLLCDHDCYIVLDLSNTKDLITWLLNIAGHFKIRGKRQSLKSFTNIILKST